MKWRSPRVVVGLSIACLVFPGALLAQTEPAQPEPEGWQNTLALYGWGTNIDGDMTVGPVDNSAAVDFAQILGALELAAMARYRGQNDRWALVVDGMFAGLGGTREGFLLDADLDFDEIIVQADAAYRLNENVEFLAGARYVRLQTTLKVATVFGDDYRFENDATFVDPLVGVRFFAAPGEKLRFQAQADIGGGATMDLTWQGMLNLGWQATGRVSLWFGYRAIRMEFDDSGERNLFSADLLSHGPLVGAALHF